MLCRNPTGMVLIWYSFRHGTGCCVSWKKTDPVPSGSRCQMDLDRVLPAVPRLPIIGGEENAVDTCDTGKHCRSDSARVDNRLDL